MSIIQLREKGDSFSILELISVLQIYNSEVKLIYELHSDLCLYQEMPHPEFKIRSKTFYSIFLNSQLVDQWASDNISYAVKIRNDWFIAVNAGANTYLGTGPNSILNMRKFCFQNKIKMLFVESSIKDFLIKNDISKYNNDSIKISKPKDSRKMKLQSKTLEKLRLLINEETEYRKGPILVKFFNEFGFNDLYGEGFPSRWTYTDEKLSKINGTPEIDKCIRQLFSPVNFIGRFDELDKHIAGFNEYLAFDKWKVVRNGTEIVLTAADKINFDSTKLESNEDDFLSKDFNEISLSSLGLDTSITQVLELRLKEIKKCIIADASLAVIFLCGSTLEGILIGLTSQVPREFNTAKLAPKDVEQKVKNFKFWTLNDLINVSCEIGFINEDVKKFGHAVRDFRNYIHPHEQLISKFNPDKHTANISWQVLKAVICQISNRKEVQI